MKVLLRDSENGLYYAGPGEWVPERADATDFQLIERALQTNVHQNLGASHVVLAYDSPACNVTLPITKYIGIVDSGSLAELSKSASKTI